MKNVRHEMAAVLSMVVMAVVATVLTILNGEDFDWWLKVMALAVAVNIFVGIGALHDSVERMLK